MSKSSEECLVSRGGNYHDIKIICCLDIEDLYHLDLEEDDEFHRAVGDGLL